MKCPDSAASSDRLSVSPRPRAGVAKGGFGSSQTTPSGMGSLELGVRVGLGLAGVLSEAGDGLVCSDLGFRNDGPSRPSIFEDEEIKQFGQILAAVPLRSAFTVPCKNPILADPSGPGFLRPVSPSHRPGDVHLHGGGWPPTAV